MLRGAGTLTAFDAGYDAVVQVLARRDRLDEDITAMAADSLFTAVTKRLCCLRGISTLTGFALAVEIGDWHRVTGASIAAYLGWCPPSTPRADHPAWARSRRPATVTPAGCGSNRPDITSTGLLRVTEHLRGAGRPDRLRERGRLAGAGTQLEVELSGDYYGRARPIAAAREKQRRIRAELRRRVIGI